MVQRVSVSNLIAGLVVAKNIYNADGSLLLAEGMVLTDTYIKRLEAQNIHSAYIKNPYIDDIEVPEVIREATRVKAINNVQTCFNRFRLTHKLDIDSLMAIANKILDEVFNNKDAMIHLTDIRSYDDYTFSHSVNVCVLSVLIGLSLDYPETKLKELALGALLHDFGKIAIPKEILNKPGKLTDEEFAQMKEHSTLGFEVLRRKQELSLIAAHIALDHHEKYDGTGYPRGILRNDIHEYSRIVAIADVYDALTSDRPYRKALPPHQAYEILMATSGTHFDADILAVFLKYISIYPVGCVVELDTGALAVVVKVYNGVPWRPCLKAIVDENGCYCQPKMVDLTKNLTITVQRVLNEEEVLALIKEGLITDRDIALG